MYREKTRSAQSTTEYMLLLSVIVIAIVAAAYVFVEPFQEGVNSLALDVQGILSTGDLTASGAQ